jgi:hypothetical protein
VAVPETVALILAWVPGPSVNSCGPNVPHAHVPSTPSIARSMDPSPEQAPYIM